jgi:hypothetical protein
MKKTWLTAIALGLATASHATLIDDFDALNPGSINQLSTSTPNPSSGWLGTAELTTTGAGVVITDPIAGSDQALQITSANSTGTSAGRGVYKALGANTIFDGQSGTLSFELAAASTTSTVRNYFGIGNAVNNPANGNFNQFEASVFFQTGKIYAMDASSGLKLNIEIGDYAANTWYSFDLVMDTANDTYDVYMNSVLVGDNFGFRNGTQSLDLDKITFWSSGVGTPNNTAGYLDNITLVTVVPEPTATALITLLGGGLLFIRRRFSR